MFSSLCPGLASAARYLETILTRIGRVIALAPELVPELRVQGPVEVWSLPKQGHLLDVLAVVHDASLGMGRDHAIYVTESPVWPSVDHTICVKEVLGRLLQQY